MDRDKQPIFNFDLIGETVGFDPEELAEKVFWPLTNEKWQGDWLRESVPGPDFVFPKVEFYDGVWTRVILTAGCDLRTITACDNHGSSVSSEMIRSCEIIVEESANDMTEHFLTIAFEEIPEELTEWVDEDGVVKHTDGIVARRGISYCFDTDGDYVVMPYFLLETIYGEDVWSSRDKEDHDEDDDVEEDEVNGEIDIKMEFGIKVQITEEDIKKLIIACEILNAPAEIRQYLHGLL